MRTVARDVPAMPNENLASDRQPILPCQADHEPEATAPGGTHSSPRREFARRVFERVYRSIPGRLGRQLGRRLLGPELTLKVWQLGQRSRQRILGSSDTIEAPLAVPERIARAAVN